ncbi:uncharacterized protein LOC141914234 [Tubulanus polymorphus]|uniref:uncharacterized protein LOC141914234 n=1 Tax=Tubulanus polymorphus TaxID=672921 RepID=UPI003DA3A7A6
MNSTQPQIGRPYASFIVLMSVVNRSGASRYLSSVILAVLFALGAFGNSATFLIMTTQRFRNLSYVNYLIVLSLTDFVICINFTLMPVLQFALFNQRVDPIFLMKSLISCRIYEFVMALASSTSSWLIVAISLERAAVVFFPFASRSICTPTFARFTITIITAANALFIYFLPIMSKQYSERYLGCYYESSNQLQFLTVIVIYLYIVPLTVIIASNTVIVIRLLFAGSKFVSSDRKTTKSKRTTIMLVTVSLAFATFTLPSTITTLSPIPFGLKQFLYDIFVQFHVCNYVVNFYVYLLLGRKIREYFCAKVCCRISDQ